MTQQTMLRSSTRSSAGGNPAWVTRKGRKMKKHITMIIVLTLLCLSCNGKFIIEEKDPPKVITEEVNCKYWGYCYSFMESRYTWTWCDGDQMADVEYVDLYGHYEKKPDKKLKKTRRRILRKYGECD